VNDGRFGAAAHFDGTGDLRFSASGASPLTPAHVTVQATLHGAVAINGLYLPVPEANESQYDTSDQSFTIHRVSIEIGTFHTFNIDLGHVQAFPLDHGAVHVTDVLLKGANAALGALPIKDKISIDLLFHASRTRFHLALPPPFARIARRRPPKATCT
jgi:hypothetical protein